jgi:hypothetical protein
MTYPGPPAGYPPEPPAAPTEPRTLRLGDLLVAFGALVVFGFSFAPFIEYGERAAFLFGVLDVPLWFNAWSLQTFMVPLTTFVILAALLSIAAAAVRFGIRRDPELVGFRLRQLEVGLALFAFVVLLGMVASDKHAIVGARRIAEADPTFGAEEVAVNTGWGAVLMLLGTIVVLAGALLNHFGVGPVIPVATTTPAAAGQWPAGPGQPGYQPGYWQSAPGSMPPPGTQPAPPGGQPPPPGGQPPPPPPVSQPGPEDHPPGSGQR